MANGKKKVRGFIAYRSYVFKEKDPIIDALRTAYQDSGLGLKEVEEASGVKSSTLYQWFLGDTKRPQFATVSAVALALGKTSIVFNKGKPGLK